ncbi:MULTISPECIES: peptidoglycan recognition protein family protein [Streptomyces]|uniref:Peptidoglycan recognition protein n=1 Tax=Streptomyces doebereineriae TaxID=3075528 RepID=A0ABU2VRG4_9ACTN|nr:peptidoglycan recognition protein [Streptomyces sp. DSM 41640]MDT0487696.1 peptidoglycan recognition protein [Streptomyces sp. DSM 41640]
MRGLLASSVGVTCAAALALSLTSPAVAARPVSPAAERPAGAEAPGSTQSLPLAPLASRDFTLAPADEQGLPRRDVRHFSLAGVIWDDPDTELHGRVQIRTRAAGTGTWSGWQDLEAHNDDIADPGTAERISGRVHGATAPLWVGDSDGVEVRVRAEADHRAEGMARGSRTVTTTAPLPAGLRLELVDPGESAPASTRREAAAAGAPHRAVARSAPTPEPAEDPATMDTSAPTAEPPEDPAAMDASAANAGLAAPGAIEIPALDRQQTEQELFALRAGELTERQRAKPYIGARPRIVTRRGWGADEGLRERRFVYTKKVKAAFVHHTASGNGYRCTQVPSLIRGIYRYHVKSMGWRDIGYNFLVDKCGNIYEGRAGGVAKAVLGAHTLGFNTNSMGIAVVGSYGSKKPPAAATTAVARLAAWKLGLYGANPKGKTYLKSGGGNRYPKGKKVRLNVISGHRDGFATECPGRKLYRKLGSTRTTAARLQGR